MKKLLPVFYFVVYLNQIALCRQIRNILGDNVILRVSSPYHKPYTINNGGEPYHRTPRFDYYESREFDDESSEFKDSDQFILPNQNWGVAATTKSPISEIRVRQCITSCRPNAEYDPVCGTDSVTYHDLDQLQCFKNCGLDVGIRQLSACQSWDGSGTTASPVVTTAKANLETCMSSCPTTPEYNPVCGSDNVTYKNHGKLLCAQFCGKDVDVSRRAPCPKLSPILDPIYTTSTTPRATTLSSAVQACMISCDTSAEYSPVCSSNKQTYFNLSRLQCAIDCGVEVSLLKSVACHLEISTNSSKEETESGEDDGSDKIDVRFNS